MKPLTSITPILIAAMLCVAGSLTAQQRPPRPPVAGDREVSALPPDTVIPQEFYIERPTLKCAGFEWYVSGDDNHNATVTVQFREVGTASWREGLPLLRIQREKIWGHEQRDVYETPNMFAGSIFGMEPATTYECQFTMADPDGLLGEAEKGYSSLQEPFLHPTNTATSTTSILSDTRDREKSPRSRD
jgi:hypothetical protein